MAIQVIGDTTRILRNWNIVLPQNIKIVFCNDLNCHMCKVKQSND